jgi:hypothetical protein
LRRNAATNGQRHGQRNGDNANRYPGNQVARETRQAIFFLPAGLDNGAEWHDVWRKESFHRRLIPGQISPIQICMLNIY